MNYQKIQPPDHLKDYVQYFWTLNSNVAKTFSTIADGCPGLIIQHSSKSNFYQNTKHLPGMFLYGQATTHAEIHVAEQFSTIGVCFYPNALKSVFGINANELTDSCLDFDLFSRKHGYHLYEHLLNENEIAKQLDLLAAYLWQLINRNNALLDKQIQYSLLQIVNSRGTISLKQLQNDLQISERSFERRFKQHIGISPKLYTRIFKFKQSLNQLKNNDYQKLSDIAYGNDYADQSHFIRTFKEFAGFSPFQYQAQSNVVIENTPVL